MPYTLYGSQASPFVRRLRMLLNEMKYDFKEMNIFETQDAVILNKINPLNQVPVLQHDEKTIWDSRQIFQYLNGLHHFQKLDWKEENLLTSIEGAMDSGISLVLMKRSGMNIDENYMFINRQKERIESVLDYLSPVVKDHGLSQWNFSAMTLYSFLDWALFRNVINLEQRSEFKSFLEMHSNRPAVTLTAIPKV